MREKIDNRDALHCSQKYLLIQVKFFKKSSFTETQWYLSLVYVLMSRPGKSMVSLSFVSVYAGYLENFTCIYIWGRPFKIFCGRTYSLKVNRKPDDDDQAYPDLDSLYARW